MMETSRLLTERKASVEAALAIFDQLEPVGLDFMQGQWRGYEIETGHPMEGLLGPSGWYGKLFLDPERVHPLLIYAWRKHHLFAIDPLLLPLGWPLPRTRVLRLLMALLRPIVQTRKPKARLRMMLYRKQLTATMVYDGKAIVDHFVRIDEQRVLGLMDQKGVNRPYFFVLEREAQPWKLRIQATA